MTSLIMYVTNGIQDFVKIYIIIWVHLDLWLDNIKEEIYLTMHLTHLQNIYL